MAEDDIYELQSRIGKSISRVTNKKVVAEIDSEETLVLVLDLLLETLDHIEFISGKLAELEDQTYKNNS